MSKAEAITRIDRFLSYLEEIYTPQCDCEEALIRKDDITAFVIARDALKEQRPHGEWRDFSDMGFVECPFCEHATTCDDNIEELHYCFFCGAELRKSGETE